VSHLVLDGLTRSFGGARVVDGIDLSVARGSFVALLGPSGCGKTTTLRMVAGLERPEAGRVLVDGQDVTALPPYRRRMGVVFQSYALFPHMTAAGNVAFGLEMRGVGRAERTRRATAALAMVGLPAHGQARPRTLSGGQQQRVALARALAIEPDVLLLDEPLSALDAKLREELRGEMRAIQRRVGATALFVTHDQAEALAMADLVAVMDGGRISQLGPPEAVFERPANAFVAGFVGRSARFSGVIEGDGIRCGPALLRAEALRGQGEVRVFVRPHRIRLLAPGEAAENVAEGTITALDYAGEVLHATVTTPVGIVPVELGTADGAWRGLAIGQAVRAGWSAADTLWFAA
jgi:putative spermidine/putrescine transport system ATP-binding protein